MSAAATSGPQVLPQLTSTYLSPGELVQRWRDSVSTKTLANWRVRGFGPKFLKLGNRIVYPLDQILAWESVRLHDQTRKEGK